MHQETAKPISVMVTRSGRSGEELSESLQQNGINSWHIPTLEIIPEDLLLPVPDFQQAIFVSPNAVKYSVEKSQLLKERLPAELIAVGKGTAECLQRAGFKQVIYPTEFNSEGLLDLAPLQSVKGQQILIIKGRGGRGLIAEELTKRGASCHYLEVYSRVSAQLDEASLQAFLAPSEYNIVIISSIDAMNALHGNLPIDFSFKGLTLIVASQRIKDSALQYGYKHIVVANSATNEAMQSAVLTLVGNSDQEIK